MFEFKVGQFADIWCKAFKPAKVNGPTIRNHASLNLTASDTICRAQNGSMNLFLEASRFFDFDLDCSNNHSFNPSRERLQNVFEQLYSGSRDRVAMVYVLLCLYV